MRRRQFGLFFLAAGVRLLAATGEAAKTAVQGKLVQHTGEPAVLQTDSGQQIKLSGDDDTEKVLHDPRLAGVRLEAIGHFTTPGEFAMEPSFEKNMWVLKNGKRLQITYYCDICSIRTYAPGVCVCCQKWTDLDLREPDQE